MSDGGLAAPGGDGDLLALGVAREGLVDHAFIFRRAAGDNCQIFLFYGALHELTGQLALRFARFGEEEDAAGLFVEPVDEAGAGKMGQDVVRLATAGDGGEACRFVDREDIFVLPKNFGHRVGILWQRSC